MYKEPRPQLPWIPLSEALPYGSKIWFSRNLRILLGLGEKRQLKPTTSSAVADRNR